MLLLLADLGSVMTLAGVILVVAIGLGAVIFVHELGHFLVAKACGVKCEKFMIGFDIGGYKLSRQWGETEYGIGILPLGGYVKMLGQDDDPAHIADEMRRCEVTAGSSDAVEVTGPNGEHYWVDRRSYLAKSVPQRMAIISAGVVMNVIFAFIFAVVAYGLGVKYMPSIASETMPGSPAWRAGHESGDEIVKLGDRTNPTFMQLKGGVTLGDLENGIPVVVRRAADGEEKELRLTPEVSDGRGLATIGIRPPFSLTLQDEVPVVPDSPAAAAQLVEPRPSGADAEAASFKSGDEIIRVNNEPVKDFRDLMAVLARSAAEPLSVTVRRPLQERTADKKDAEEFEELTFKIGARPLKTLGLIMKMGPIVAVQPDSPAKEAGLEQGDQIVAVDGQSLDDAKTATGWQADTFAEKAAQAALAGESLTLSDSARFKASRDFHDAANSDAVPFASAPRHAEGVPALGIAYRIENEVAAVVPGSPAAAAEIQPGDNVTSAKFIYPDNVDKKLLGEDEPIESRPRNRIGRRCSARCNRSPAGTQARAHAATRGGNAHEEARTDRRGRSVYRRPRPVVQTSRANPPRDHVRRASAVRLGRNDRSTGDGLPLFEKDWHSGAGDGLGRTDHDRQGGRPFGLQRPGGVPGFSRPCSARISRY